jgi:hypothetical protein
VNPHRLLPSFVAVLSAASLAACAWSVPADPGLVAECRPCKPGCAHLRREPVPSETAPPSAASVAGAAAAAPPATPRATSSPPSPRNDAGARTIYTEHCSRCHAAFPPTHATAAEWPVFVRKYGPRAGLFGSDRDRVLAWLQANAR